MAELGMSVENTAEELDDCRVVGAELVVTAVNVVRNDAMLGDTEIIEVGAESATETVVI